jgi:hypothetical protein
MRTLRDHRCQRQHRSHRTLARCIWKRAAWNAGDGPYAVLDRCHERPTVSLHATVAAAMKALESLDGIGCGELVRLDLTPAPDRDSQRAQLEALNAARLPYRDD